MISNNIRTLNVLCVVQIKKRRIPFRFNHPKKILILLRITPHYTPQRPIFPEPGYLGVSISHKSTGLLKIISNFTLSSKILFYQ